MEWLLLFLWLTIINGALAGQYILNWMGNQPRFVGDRAVGISPGVMTWWRELSKLLWAVVAVTVEVSRRKNFKYLWPGIVALTTIIICAFTGVIENIGFFYLPRYYSPHVYAPYVNIYLVFLPFFGKFVFKSTIRKEHWLGAILVVLGLTIPYLPNILGKVTDPKAVLDSAAIIWIVIINICLCSQQVLNNKTVQTAKHGVGPNALVVWREIWKMLFITSALFIFPLIGGVFHANLPEKIPAAEFENTIIEKLADDEKPVLFVNYKKVDDVYFLRNDIDKETRENVRATFSSIGYDRFFSLFDGSILPKNWWPILFVVLAGLSGYIYSYGFFKLAKYAAHYWVPYTNVYLAVIPFVMFLFGEHVTKYQVIGAVITTAGLMIGVSDYKRNKVEAIENTYKEKE